MVSDEEFRALSLAFAEEVLGWPENLHFQPPGVPWVMKVSKGAESEFLSPWPSEVLRLLAGVTPQTQDPGLSRVIMQAVLDHYRAKK